jgi:ASC-1-like (ASCH) protein
MSKVVPHKTHTLPFARKDSDIWKLIKEGKKTVETRAAGPKYEHIQAGDVLIFSCAGKKFKMKIKKVSKFRTLSAMFKHYDPQLIHPGIEGKKALIERYHSFTGYKERIKQYGMLAFELVK